MKTEIPGVDWLLNCEPRPAQLEALARSYTGVAYRDNKNEEPHPERLFGSGRPASGWGHFMEMRVGKTPTALNEMMLFSRDYSVNKAFMLSPSKYKNTWALEAAKFGYDKPVLAFNSSDRKEAAAFIEKNPEGLIIANYEALIYPESTKLFEKWIDKRTYFGADESVMMKNKESQFFKNANVLAKGAAVTRPMTGKPVVQGPHDLYSQLRFARHLDGWDFVPFRNKFCVMGGHRGKQVTGEKNSEALQRILRVAAFYARRKDWATSFDPDYERRAVPMRPEQQKIYDEMERNFVIWLENGDSVTAEQVITKRMKMQQISSGFIYDEDRVTHEITPLDKLPKFLELKYALENEIRGKTHIVCVYNPSIHRLLDALKDYNPAVIAGDQTMKAMAKEGRISSSDTDTQKARFNGDPNCRVIISQERAVKYGHTLIVNPSDVCRTTVYYENTYSLDDRAQSEQRNQGEGQQEPTHVIDFFGSEIEEEIVDALVRKESIAARVMGYYDEKTHGKLKYKSEETADEW